MTTPAVPADDGGDAELRALAAEFIKATDLGYTPATFIKGIVTAIDVTGVPPTLSINVSGDTTTTLSNVRMMNNYSPEVGHTIVIAKMNADLLVIGNITGQSALSVNNNAGGWKRASISNGNHGGNSNGDIYYRRIQDHGSWKMQWRGGWDPAGATILIDPSTPLDAEFRPSSKRSVLCARQIQSGSVTAQFDFKTDGSIELVGSTTAPFVSNANSSPGTNSVDPVDTTTDVDPLDSTTVSLSGYQSLAGSDLGHTHGVVGSHSHGVVGAHSHTVNAHNHVTEVWVDPPTWVSLNGVEYFL